MTMFKGCKAVGKKAKAEHHEFKQVARERLAPVDHGDEESAQG
jgi:hypothetical protein